MIRACSWCSAENCGVVTFNGRESHFHAPAPVSNGDLTSFLQRPIKYLSRMTRECRAGLCAASLAMQTCGWLENSPGDIGLVGAGYEGCLIADQNYFRDYVASGRSLGRGSLFIYTLPSSTLGEIAIALALTGPGLHMQGEADPLGTLAREAARFVADREADAMLALWSDANSAICLAIDVTTDASGKASPSPGVPGESQGGGWRGELPFDTILPLDATQPPPQPSPGVPGEGESSSLTARPTASASLTTGAPQPWRDLFVEPDPTSLARRLAKVAGAA